MPIWLMGLLASILGVVLRQVSPAINDAIEKFLDDLEKKAKATTNTIDDVLVDWLREILKRAD